MWKNRNVWTILAGEFGAGLGLWVGIIGNLEFLQRHVPSDFMKSLILFVGLLAGVLVGPLAGRIIDQHAKKTVLLYAGFGRLFSVVFMFLALYFDNVLFMVLFMIFIQISAAFYFPALQAAIPLIVPKDQLLQLNSIHMNIATIARIIGASIGGVLLVVISLYELYALSMAAYVLLLLSTYLLRFDGREATPERNASTNNNAFTDVFRVLKDVPIAWNALVLNIIPLLFIGGFNLMVINISELQDDPAIKGMLYTAEGLAFLAGAFCTKRISDRMSPHQLLYTLSFVIAFAHLSLFFSDIKWMAIFSFALFGFGVGCFFPIVSTIFQTKIDASYHGRLFSFRNMFERIMFQIVLLGTGLLLDTIGLQYMVLVFGIGSLVITGMSLAKHKKTKKHTMQKNMSL